MVQTQYVETFKISHHAHVYQSSKAVRQIVDLNVPLMKIALVIWHVLIKDVGILVLVRVELMLNVKYLNMWLYVLVSKDLRVMRSHNAAFFHLKVSKRRCIQLIKVAV